MRRTLRLAMVGFGLLALLATPAAVADPPTLTVTDVTEEATGPDGAAVSYSVSAAAGNAGNSVDVVCTPASGGTFGLGTTQVSCTATDTTTLEATTQTFNVTVRDTTRPAFTSVPGSITQEATGGSGASVSYSLPSASDAVGGVTVSCSPGPGSTFGIGTTPVQCTATDGAGNRNPDASFTVTVRDTTSPSLSVPGNQTLEAASSSGTAATFQVSASDSVSGGLTPSCSPASGSTFPLGNTRNGSFTITVRDTKAPTVTVPGDKTAEAAGPSGARVTYSGVSASDAIAGQLTPSCDHASGATFRLGSTTVKCTATDPSGNSASGSFKIIVRDTVDPVLTLPGEKTAEASGSSGAKVSYGNVHADDNVSGRISANCSPGSGAQFPLGTTSVNCTATDGSGNSASGSFPVTVRDTKAPTITVPGPITVEARSAGGAAVSYSGVSANDAVSGKLSPSCDRASGSTFPLGTTTVTCTAKDGSGNSASGSFAVHVKDGAPPDFTNVPGDMVVEANGPKGTVVRYTVPTAVDSVDGPVQTSCNHGPGATFPIGQTRVLCTAKDGRDNSGSASFLVTVADKAIPVLTAPAPAKVSSNGAESVAASAPSVAGFLAAAVAEDLVDGKIPVKNDAPATFPVGTTTVTFSAQDKSGNTATARSQVVVVKEAVQPTKPLDRTPPQNVRALRARAGDRAVTLRWSPPADKDFKQVLIMRSTRTAPIETPVYRGAAKRFVDKKLANGVDYRYLVISYDRAGNRSAGVAISALPKAAMLVSPSDGARVKAPPLLRWVRVAGASYYNVQLFRGSSAVKIMSIWPALNHVRLPKTWRYNGRRERLKPGVYRWLVWPGFGSPVSRNYGSLLGFSTFTVAAGKK